MADDGRYAVATMVLSGRVQVVLIRPVDKLLAITVLSYDTQLKKPTDFESEVPNVAAGAAEVKLARTLIEASTAENFDFAKYQDEYTDHVRKLVERKAAGKKIVGRSQGGEPAIINLMDALRESLNEAKGNGRGSYVRRNGHAPRRPAKSRRAPRRRKVG
jgi:DNA end-binding protein Ku